MNRILDDMENCSWMANEDPTKPDSTGECHKKRKRIYRRRVNPPYSYVAMIALALQNAPERKLKLPQIFSEISTLFPFFKGDHWGWKDTVRHNLSCNDCFRKHIGGILGNN
ncbi:forkhead activin signal transducer 3-like isoform X2 [Lithobates pipiens]